MIFVHLAASLLAMIRSLPNSDAIIFNSFNLVKCNAEERFLGTAEFTILSHFLSASVQPAVVICNRAPISTEKEVSKTDYRHEWKHAISYGDLLILREKLEGGQMPTDRFPQAPV